MKLYEILVPLFDNEGVKFPNELRERFLAEAYRIAGGATFPDGEVYGVWNNPDGKLMYDRLIRVHVAVSQMQQITQLMEAVRKIFNQQSVMAFKVSDEVLFVDGTGA